MAKITRAVQKIFGSTSGFQQVSQYGSLANGTPNFTLDPVVIQALTQYTNGWFDAAIGSNSPAIEDMNALCYLYAYQLAYLMQEGIAEWDATTTYFIGSMVQDGTGAQYISTLDTNLNNSPGTIGWFPIGTVGLLNQTIGNVTTIANRRMASPSPITIAAASTVSVPASSVMIVPESISIPPDGVLSVDPSGKVNII